jgi:zinc protease
VVHRMVLAAAISSAVYKFVFSIVSSLVLALVLALVFADFAVAQNNAGSAPIQRIQTVEGITEYRLDNGLKVLLAPDSSANTVTVSVTYRVGSKHEGSGETGMAHLLEHLVFKGTPTTADPKSEFRRRGFSFNGTTSEDRTNYFATFGPDAANLDWYLSWQADAMVNSFIARKDLDSEMTVVRNEFEIRENNPVQVLTERTLSSAYLWHNYGKAIIGARADIENVDIANLQAFYKRFYRPDNALLVIAGKFDEAASLASIARFFSPLKKPPMPLPASYTLDPAQDGERSVVVRRASPQQVMLTAYHVPPDIHPDSEPLQILAIVLGDAPDGRLHKALVETKLAITISVGVPQLQEGGTFRAVAVMSPQADAEKTRERLFQVIEGLAAEPVSGAEFERARNKLSVGIERMFASSASVAALATAAEVKGDWRSLFVSRDRYRTITLEDVNRAARTYLLRDNRTFGHLIPTSAPQRAPAPKFADVASFMQGAQLKEQTDTVASFDYDPLSLGQRVIRSVTPGGIRLSVAEKAVRADYVNLLMSFRFGSLASLDRRATAASMLAPMLRRGAGGMSQSQIDAALLKLGATVQISTSAEGGSARLVVKKEQLPEAIALLARLLKEPDFPVDKFEELKASAVSAAIGASQDPSTRVRNEFARYGDVYATGDPRHAPTLEQNLTNLQSLALTDVKQFYASHVGAQQALVAVVGPVSPAAVQGLLVQHFDAWKAPSAYERIAKPLVARQPARLRYDTPDKSNASIDAYLQAPIKQDDRDYWPMQMATSMLGAALFERLREKEGLSYSVNARFNADLRDARASVVLHADVAPSNLLRAEALLREELTRSLNNGFTAPQLERQRAQQLAERRRVRTNDEWLLGVMSTYQELDWPYTIILENDARITAMTLDEVNIVWRKYVDSERWVWGLFADPSKLLP